MKYKMITYAKMTSLRTLIDSCYLNNNYVNQSNIAVYSSKYVHIVLHKRIGRFGQWERPKKMADVDFFKTL